MGEMSVVSEKCVEAYELIIPLTCSAAWDHWSRKALVRYTEVFRECFIDCRLYIGKKGILAHRAAL